MKNPNTDTAHAYNETKHQLNANISSCSYYLYSTR